VASSAAVVQPGLSSASLFNLQFKVGGWLTAARLLTKRRKRICSTRFALLIVAIFVVNVHKVLLKFIYVPSSTLCTLGWACKNTNNIGIKGKKDSDNLSS